MLKRLRAVPDVQKSIFAIFTCSYQFFTLLDFINGDNGWEGAELFEYGVEMAEIFDILFEIGVAARRPQGPMEDFLHWAYYMI